MQNGAAGDLERPVFFRDGAGGQIFVSSLFRFLLSGHESQTTMMIIFSCLHDLSCIHHMHHITPHFCFPTKGLFSCRIFSRARAFSEEFVKKMFEKKRPAGEARFLFLERGVVEGSGIPMTYLRLLAMLHVCVAI
jgi:hypothetical protein